MLSVLLLSEFYVSGNQHWCFQLQTLMNVSEAPDGTKVKRKKIKQQVARIALSFFAC